MAAIKNNKLDRNRARERGGGIREKRVI